MKTTVLTLAAIAAPFVLTGCGAKTCADLQADMEDLQEKMTDLDEAQKYADEWEALLDQMIDVCAREEAG